MQEEDEEGGEKGERKTDWGGGLKAKKNKKNKKQGHTGNLLLGISSKVS